MVDKYENNSNHPRMANAGMRVSMGRQRNLYQWVGGGQGELLRGSDIWAESWRYRGIHQAKREEKTSSEVCAKAPEQTCCGCLAGPWGVCVCLHTHVHAMRKQKGTAQQEVSCLGWIRKGALYVMLRSLEFIPKPQGAIERGFKQGSAVIRFAC